MSVATAPTTGVATTLRVFRSTVGSGATTAADTFCIAEIAVPAIASDATTSAVSPYDVILNFAIPTGTFIHVSQHVAQTSTATLVTRTLANGAWTATSSATFVTRAAALVASCNTSSATLVTRSANYAISL